MDFLFALIASVIAAAIPTLIYVVLAWWLDRYEKEPIWLLSITFLWGAVPAIVVSLVAELVLDIPIQAFVTGEGADLLSTALVAPVVEEIAKGVVLLLIYWRYRKEFDGLMDGLIYGALVGFGFAMTENVFYFLDAYSQGGWESWGILVFMRAIIFGLNHALFTSAFGAGLGYARYALNPFTRRIAPLLGLLLAIMLHAIHNFFVSVPNAELLCLVSLAADYLGIIAWLALMWFATYQEKQWITEELAEEVADGVLSAEHTRAAASYRTRLRDRLAEYQEHGFGRAHRLRLLHQIATELAFKKRQLRIHGDEQGNAAEIAKLRAQIGQLMQELG
ncbi:MAG: PrsW family intramembrane metalloprotease [Ardenticatenaceae bacterium]